MEQPGGSGRAASLGSFATYKGDLNELSVVLLLRYKSISLLLPGDITQKEELAMLNNHLLTETEVLKVAHHGSKYSTTSEFLTAIKPKLAVIEVGKNNRFGHPTAETLMRLEAVGASIKRTDNDGEVRVKSDGDQFWLW
jgi:beta-lactamase superfamily II metal-dependent hydrolase